MNENENYITENKINTKNNPIRNVNFDYNNVGV